MRRLVHLLYGLASYAAFLATLVYAVGFVGGFATPTRLDGTPTASLGTALAIDAALLLLFALQHSTMARPWFKRWATTWLPRPVERSTYVLASSAALALLFWLWQPIGGRVWSAESEAARAVVLSVYAAGWLLLLYATLLIDHFELFGLRQVWCAWRGTATPQPRFVTPSLYRVVRHPIYVAWLTIFWAAPTMTLGHLVFAIATTVYILVAIRLEERDLVSEHGAAYEAYRASVPMLVPRLGRRTPT